MQKNKIWQAFLVAGIVALATPAFVQAEGTSSNMPSGSGAAVTSPSAPSDSTATPGTAPTAAAPSAPTAAPSAPTSSAEPAPAGMASPGAATNDEAKTDADRALNQSIRQALAADTTLASSASSIQLKTDEGEVKLEGTVTNKDAKKMIEEKVEKIAGVKDVENELEVPDTDTPSSSSMGSGGSSSTGSGSGLSGSGSSSGIGNR